MGFGSIYLIPTLLGDSDVDQVLPANLSNILAGIRHYVVEDLRTARRFLRKIDSDFDIDSLEFSFLNEHTSREEIPDLLQPARSGHNMGLMSEAGMPCMADPGAELVSMAHEQNIRVIPLSGPSSITLALIASGFNGQNFAFHGYLPIENRERISAIKKLEQDVYRHNQTQIFMETPYRNMKLFETIIKTCSDDTRLCIAANLTGEKEIVRTLTISQWKKNPLAIHKQPAVFLIYK